MSDLRFDGRVAIVTGAGNGLGRAHALLLAARGAKVVVNDLGGSGKGDGKSSAAADKVVEEIKAAGGEAVANYDSVEDGDKIVQTALDTWKRVDVVINNAGILRDTSFKKLTDDDWDLIYRVHVRGSYKVTKAAWDHMQEAGYGRIIFTASAAGIYGNFGQANYAMAKLGLVGFSNTLAIEGKKKNVLVNTIAPIAGSRLTETVLPKNITDALKPEYVSPLVAWLVHESCEETGGLFEVGGGLFTKLRWERTEGKLFKLGRDITPDQVKKAWSQITSFEKATHPANINESMGPILGNLESRALGGNDLIDVDTALGYEFPPQKSSYDEKDLALYALGVGAGAKATDPKELQYLYENDASFRALPTFGVVPALSMVFEMAKRGETAPGMNYGFDRILHGEQYTELRRPLPPSAKLTHKAKIKEIWDKGKGAVVVTAITSFDEDGNELVYNELSTFVRGAGGWGGERGPSAEVNVAPDRKPDAIVEEKISESQALLYRLSGDINPLHVDPGFAKAFGFEKPILHGLCTFGFAARHVIKSFSNDDPRFFKSIKVRFSDSVFPGETLVTEMWKEGEKIVFRCKVKERDKVVISNAAVELYKEIPKAPEKKKAAAATAAAAAPSGEPTSAEAFAVIRDHIEQNGGLASEIGKTFLFKLSGPDSAWTLDLKNGKGGVSQGGSSADCVLELSDADFCAMVAGKADPMKLWTEKKLKISGDVMASQKLMFLKKIDPKRGAEVVAKLRAAGGGAPAAAAAGAAPSGEPTSAEAFAVIRDHIEQNGGLAAEIGKTFLFRLSSPDSAWTLDLKNGKGSVTEGGTAGDCVLDLSDEDFRAMVAGKADPMKLWTDKKLKISGDVMASQKLMFLKKIDPKRGAEVVAKLRGSGGGAAAGGGGAAPAAKAAAPAAAAPSQAPAIVKALGERLAKTPNLAKEVGAKVGLVVGTASWLLDLTGAGAITEGKPSGAAATLTLDDETLVALAKGESLRDLYMHGRVRIDGDPRVAHKLTFFKGLV
ncbi:MAG: SDR family NAD(P)-dependent oxidoreductase [Labilithrix sp.]|nr:SDR family NAD(P)-dependent oxidoreductase [Labilithrix sp.]MCW5810336.1 SDR family NAD(P)-dependent oxidoreductase [Labilithrix sp.]